MRYALKKCPWECRQLGDPGNLRETSYNKTILGEGRSQISLLWKDQEGNKWRPQERCATRER